jgi:hypothetical protein
MEFKETLRFLLNQKNDYFIYIIKTIHKLLKIATYTSLGVIGLGVPAYLMIRHNTDTHNLQVLKEIVLDLMRK